eukprot:824220-Rhodomonas_salina.1
MRKALLGPATSMASHIAWCSDQRSDLQSGFRPPHLTLAPHTYIASHHPIPRQCIACYGEDSERSD